MVNENKDDLVVEDDSTIDDDTELLRRIPPWHFIPDGKGAFRASSAAFENDKDGSPMSIAITDELEKLDLKPESILNGHNGFGLVGFSAGLARKYKQIIVKDPLPNEPAHGLVIGKKTGSVKSNLSKNSVWIVPPPK